MSPHKYEREHIGQENAARREAEEFFDRTQSTGAISGAGAADPWADRSSGMKCRTCVWFVPKVNQGLYAMKPEAPIVGRCRRHAPSMGGYPVVYQTDWCGDHRVDENKV